MNVLEPLLLLIVGFILLVKGADWFVDGASNIAEKFNVSQLVIGLTVVAMGTSLPEAAVSISAAFKGSAGIAVGNIVGSNIINIGLILGITGIIAPLAVQKTTRRYEIPIVILSTVILGVLGLTDNIVGRGDGLTLLGLFILYLIYTFKIAAKQPQLVEEIEEEVPVREKSTVKIIVITVLGCAGIVAGANVAVDGATDLARMFGVGEDVIGLTIVAFGTSLPELVASATAALKKEADIAIGNIVGSNIFNILFVLGASAVIHPIGYESSFFRDTIVCIAMPILLLLLITNKDKSLKRWGGVVLLVCYAAYFLICNLGIL